MYASKDIQGKTGLNKQQVWRLVEYGIIKPAENPKGRGKVRRFDSVNLAEFMIAKELYDLRAEPRQIWLTLDQLRDWKLYDKDTGEVRFRSFWHYITSDEYRKRRAKLGEEPIYLITTKRDDLDGRPIEIKAIYRQEEVGKTLADCRAAIVVNLAPIVARVFF